MKQEYVTIPLAECEQMIRYLTRAEYYCAHARSVSDPDIDLVNAEPTATYPGASGYAGATMRTVLQTLESHLS